MISVAKVILCRLIAMHSTRHWARDSARVRWFWRGFARA